jgi:hypothetical protein
MDTYRIGHCQHGQSTYKTTHASGNESVADVQNPQNPPQGNKRQKEVQATSDSACLGRRKPPRHHGHVAQSGMSGVTRHIFSVGQRMLYHSPLAPTVIRRNLIALDHSQQ